jgi:hypothetical protein
MESHIPGYSVITCRKHVYCPRSPHQSRNYYFRGKLLGVLWYCYMHLQQTLKLTDWRTDMARQRHSIPSLRLYHVYPRRLPLLCSLLCLLPLSWIRLFHDSRHGLTICNEIILYEGLQALNLKCIYNSHFFCV